jgi:cytochrome c oxidase subunit IV
MVNVEAKKIHIVSYRTCIYVWLALVLLLGATIAIAHLHLLAQYSVLAALLIASIKAGLVVTYFMHLMYEDKRLKLMLLLAVSLFTLIIAVTFIDIWYR